MKEFLDSYDMEKQGDMMTFENCGGTRLHICFLLLKSQMNMDVLSAGSWFSLAYNI